MKTTDTPAEADISGIRQDIIKCFRAMKDISQIARETGQPIGVVSSILKPVLKKDLAARVKNHGPGGPF